MTGRIKDLIIVRGRNHYPQDIEVTAQGVSPFLRPGCGAAFSVEKDGEERLVLLQELDDSTKPDGVAIAAAMRAAVLAQHDIVAQPHRDRFAPLASENVERQDPAWRLPRRVARRPTGSPQRTLGSSLMNA